MIVSKASSESSKVEEESSDKKSISFDFEQWEAQERRKESRNKMVLTIKK